MARKKLTPEEKKARHQECSRRYYENHREEIRAKQWDDYHANLEASRAYMRTWAKSYREKHREELNARERERRAAKKAQQASE
jgi:hypothetical protein